jgi:hypothetical protein
VRGAGDGMRRESSKTEGERERSTE